jgi:hypothetical protein
VNRPKEEIKFQQKEIKTSGKRGKPEKPGSQSENSEKENPSQQEKHGQH